MTTLPRRDKWIPWYFVMFFVAIALVDATMVTLAVRTHTGTVTDHAYEKGLAYNRVVAAEATQEALGWKASITLTGKQLRVLLRDSNGAPLQAQSIKAHISRPTQAGMDFDVALKDGQATIDFPLKGLWEIRIYALANGHSYQQSQRVVVE